MNKHTFKMIDLFFETFVVSSFVSSLFFFGVPDAGLLFTLESQGGRDGPSFDSFETVLSSGSSI
jgi:hypothetical protein